MIHEKIDLMAGPSLSPGVIPSGWFDRVEVLNYALDNNLVINCVFRLMEKADSLASIEFLLHAVCK